MPIRQANRDAAGGRLDGLELRERERRATLPAQVVEVVEDGPPRAAVEGQRGDDAARDGVDGRVERGRHRRQGAGRGAEHALDAARAAMMRGDASRRAGAILAPMLSESNP